MVFREFFEDPKIRADGIEREASEDHEEVSRDSLNNSLKLCAV